MKIVKFGHYYKHKTHTYNMVDRITVLDILDDGYAVCIKGHISPSDPAYQKFKMPIAKIKTTINDKEQQMLTEEDEYRRKLKRERAEAKQRKARYWEAYFEKYHALTEKLLNYNVIIPALSNLVLDDLERLLEHPEVYIPKTQGVYFKIFDYDEKNDCYHWIEV